MNITILTEENLMMVWENLSTLTGKHYDISIRLFDETVYANLSEDEHTLFFNEHLLNHPEMGDEYVRMFVIYHYCFRTGIIHRLGKNQLYDEVEWICQNYATPFISDIDLKLKLLDIGRLIFDESDSSIYEIGDKLMPAPYPRVYRVKNVGQLTENGRIITFEREDKVISLEEKEVIKNYVVIA